MQLLLLLVLDKSKANVGNYIANFLPSFIEDCQSLVQQDFVFQQDGAPPHWGTEVRTLLNQHLSKRWIGLRGAADDVFCSWPPRSPDLTPCDFYLWGYVKDRVYVLPMPKTIAEVKVRICNALASVTAQMLQNVWREMDYRLDYVRVIKGSHIEHL